MTDRDERTGRPLIWESKRVCFRLALIGYPMASPPPPSIPGGPPATATSDVERLWDLMLKQQEFSVSQFATSLIGEGALLFAYGTISPLYDFVRLIIAFLGIGAALVLWAASFATREDSRATRKILVKLEPRLMRKYEELRSWRVTSRWRYIYQSVTRLTIYTNGLIALLWFTIALYTIRWLVPLSNTWFHWLISSETLTFIIVAGLIAAGVLWVSFRDTPPQTEVA